MLIQPVQAKANDLKVDDAYVCMQATAKIEQQYQIKKHLLTTISSVETGRYNEAKKQTLAWPWTINAQGKGRYFATKEEAVRAVKKLQAQGVKSIDVGCMQINLAYHAMPLTALKTLWIRKQTLRTAPSSCAICTSRSVTGLKLPWHITPAYQPKRSVISANWLRLTKKSSWRKMT